MDIDNFTDFLLRAHHVGGEGERGTYEEIELAHAAGALAEAEGWTASIGALRSSHRNCSISSTDGVITVAWNGWKTLIYSTESISDTIQALVTARILPWIYSPQALHAIDEVVEDLHDDERLAAAQALIRRENPEPALDYLRSRHRELMSYNDDVRVA